MVYKPISILEDVVARQIAAGEVIDRPSAILRELLDNSIDSQSTSIEIHIENSGLDLIQVSDNGTGMRQEDIKLCCLPHATSKIIHSEDLSHITSMGFRGEALPSIVSVSKVNICSKHAQESYAWEIDAHNTQISNPVQASRNTGTTVKARRLFEDIPARRNFLSSPQAELGHLKTMLYQKATAFPEISFSFYVDSQAIIKIPKEPALTRSIHICSNNSIKQDFIWIENNSKNQDATLNDNMHNSLEYKLKGALGLPDIAQKTRRNIHIYINNRLVREFAILQAIEYAYRNVLHGQQHPQAVLFLTIPPEQLDVNIHPAKNEVKIKHIEIIRKLLISTIEKHLQKFAKTTPTIVASELSTAIEDAPSTIHSSNNILNNKNSNKIQEHTEQAMQTKYSYDKIFPREIFSKESATDSYVSRYKQHESTQSSHFNNVHNTNDNHCTTKINTTYNDEESSPTSSPPHQQNITNQLSKTHLTDLTQDKDSMVNNAWKYIGTVFDTYIIFEHQITVSQHSKKSTEKQGKETTNNTNQLMILDFHAAHEKILYDMLIKASTSAALLVPIPLQLDIANQNIPTILSQYSKVGIIIEEDPLNHFSLHAIPSNSPLEADKIAMLIETFPLEDTFNAKLFARNACRSATKAGDHIDINGSFALLKQVLDLEIPRCPHGRPLWITLTKTALDKMIGRIE